MSVGVREKLGLVKGLTKGSILDAQLVYEGATFLPTPVCLICRGEGGIQELRTGFESFYMPTWFEHREPHIIHQGGDRELTRLAAHERLAGLYDFARHVCFVQGLFQPWECLRPVPMVTVGLDLFVERLKGMER